jgi:O-antigen ligase
VLGIGLVLWGGLWLNLNTGLTNIVVPQSYNEWQLTVRAILPFLVLLVAAVMLVAHRGSFHRLSLGPSNLLFIYGLLAAAATVFSPDPAWAFYWSVAFLATIVAAWTFASTRRAVYTTRQMLHITWGVTLVVAAIIAFTGRGTVFGDAGSSHEILNDLSGMSRSSGVARWAAVPGLVCLLNAFRARRIALAALFFALAGVAFFIVYRMQSRGAVFGTLAALAFALVLENRMRRFALPLVFIAAVALIGIESPGMLSDRVAEYLHRGQSEEEFQSMTGRTAYYQMGFEAFLKAPIFGRGQWADRLVIGGHCHNSYLQALMNSGILGGLPYLASWIAGWVLFFRLFRRRTKMRLEDRATLMEAGTVMMFFTVRSFPETTTASFSVDLLVMAAVYTYLESVYKFTTSRDPRLTMPSGVSRLTMALHPQPR